MTTPSTYEQALSNQSVAECLLRYLELEGVQIVFGIPGAAAMHILNELKNQREKFRYVVCRHESGAAFLADGYSRVTGKLGVVLVTSGPGATNALTGTMNAQNSNSAVLTITGEVPEVFFGRGYLQEGVDANLDIDAIYRHATQYSAVVTAKENFQTLFSQALREALSLPHRAVHISIPDDIAGHCLDSVRFPNSPANYRTVPHCSDLDHTHAALAELVGAERPVILLGNGCRRALTDTQRAKEFIELVERFAIPVITTVDAKGLFPETHPLALRGYGLAACSWPRHYLLKDPANPVPFDALLVLGSSLQGLTTDRWDPTLIPNGPFMQVDLDHRVIGRDFNVAIGIIAELGVALEDLSACGKKLKPNKGEVESRRRFIRNLKKQVSPYAEPHKRDSQATPIPPQALMGCLSELLPKQTHIFIDGGNCIGWALHYLEVDPPTQVHCALDMGPMGFSVGAVVGAKIGAPEATCISITGDGGFLMHGAEVSTAAQYGVGAIWIVLNDNDLNMVSQGMNHYFPDPSVWEGYYPLGKPNLEKFSEALGADAYSVHNRAEMARVFPRAVKAAAGSSRRKPRPQVIVAHVDAREAPPYYPVPAPAYVPCSKRASGER